MLRRLPHLLTMTAALLAGAAGCAGEDEVGSDDFETVEQHAFTSEVQPHATIRGTLDANTWQYHYVVELEKGAKLQLRADVHAGADAVHPAPGARIARRMRVYGPYQSFSDKGERLVNKTYEAEDEPDTISFKAPAKGKYAVVFEPLQQAGLAPFEVSIDCGNCEKPPIERSCNTNLGTLYQDATRLTGQRVWDACEMVLLRSPEVQDGSTLKIEPGVHIEMRASTQLNAAGNLTVAGAADNPVHFTAEKSHMGIVLSAGVHKLSHLRIDHARYGVRATDNVVVDINDASIVAVSKQIGSSIDGVWVNGAATGKISRTLIKGFRTGVRLSNTTDFRFSDSVIRENGTGVLLLAQGQAVRRCGGNGQVRGRYDPVFEYTDIIHNSGVGIRVDGAGAFLQISHSNLVDNEQGAINVWGTQIAEESFIRQSNLYHTSGDPRYERQVWTTHTRGQLNLTRNYWGTADEALLSNTWQVCNEARIFPSGHEDEPLKNTGPRFEEIEIIDPVIDHCHHKTKEQPDGAS